MAWWRWLAGIVLALSACSEERDASGRFEVTVANAMWPQPVKLVRDGEPLGEVRGREGRFEFAGHARQALTAVTLTTEGWHAVIPQVAGANPDGLIEHFAHGGPPVHLSVVVPELAAAGASIARVAVDGRDAPETEVAVGQLVLPRSTELAHYQVWAPSSPVSIKVGGAELGKLAGDVAVVDVSGKHCYQVHGVAYSTLSVGFGSNYDKSIEPSRLHDHFDTHLDYVFEEPPATVTVRSNGAPFAERTVYQLRAGECAQPPPAPKKKKRQ